MKTLVGVVIPMEANKPIYRHEFPDTLESYQSVVQGIIDVVDLPSQEASMWINDEGKFGLDLNKRATDILWELEPAWRHTDVIHGPVLITGIPDEEGDTQSIPEDLLERLVNKEETG